MAGIGALVIHRLTLTLHRYAKEDYQTSVNVGTCAMVDHFAWAESYRKRAAKCQFTAKQTSSANFSDCYRLLADHYVQLADIEEDYARRTAAMQQAANRAMLSTYPSR